MLIISYFLLPMIGYAASVSYNNDRWYEKKEYTDCWGYSTVEYSTLSEAEDACNKAEFYCTMIRDIDCDGGVYNICEGEGSVPDAGTCVWIQRDGPPPSSTTQKQPTTTHKMTTQRPNTSTSKMTTHAKTTQDSNTSPYPTEASTNAPYNCMDITVDKCRDDTLDVMDTFYVESTDECYMLCSSVFQDVCNSYIYNQTSGICSILQDRFYYLDGCDVFGAGDETVFNCLSDNTKYPDQCKNMVESGCEFTANIISSQNNVAHIEECLQLSRILHGHYYLYDNDEGNCTIYRAGSRSCSIKRGIKGILPSSCPN